MRTVRLVVAVFAALPALASQPGHPLDCTTGLSTHRESIAQYRRPQTPSHQQRGRRRGLILLLTTMVGVTRSRALDHTLLIEAQGSWSYAGFAATRRNL